MFKITNKKILTLSVMLLASCTANFLDAAKYNFRLAKMSHGVQAKDYSLRRTISVFCAVEDSSKGVVSQLRGARLRVEKNDQEIFKRKSFAWLQMHGSLYTYEDKQEMKRNDNLRLIIDAEINREQCKPAAEIIARLGKTYAFRRRLATRETADARRGGAGLGSSSSGGVAVTEPSDDGRKK